MRSDVVAADGGQSPSQTSNLLTIVIPHYNQKGFLPRAVASVLDGQARAIEIIIVDDGSTDDSEPILAALEAISPLIAVIRCKKNRGAPTALNTGLAAARGRYVTFLGADDLALPSLYVSLLRALDDQKTAALACSQIAIIDSSGRPMAIRPVTPPSIRAQHLDPKAICRQIRSTDHWITSTTAVYRTDLLRAAGGFDASLGVFCDIIVQRILAFRHGFVYVPGVGGVFRVAASTLSASTLLDRDENVQQLETACEKLSTSIVGELAPYYPALFARRLRFSAARMQLVWRGRSADPDTIVKVSGGAGFDLKAIVAIRRTVGFGPVGRIFAIGWLTIRLRPFSFSSLLLHGIRNRFTFIRNRHAIVAWISRMDNACREITNAAVPGSTSGSSWKRP
jgi:hypothetical protein